MKRRNILEPTKIKNKLLLFVILVDQSLKDVKYPKIFISTCNGC